MMQTQTTLSNPYPWTNLEYLPQQGYKEPPRYHQSPALLNHIQLYEALKFVNTPQPTHNNPKAMSSPIAGRRNALIPGQTGGSNDESTHPTQPTDDGKMVPKPKPWSPPRPPRPDAPSKATHSESTPPTQPVDDGKMVPKPKPWSPPRPPRPDAPSNAVSPVFAAGTFPSNPEGAVKSKVPVSTSILHREFIPRIQEASTAELIECLRNEVLVASRRKTPISKAMKEKLGRPGVLRALFKEAKFWELVKGEGGEMM
ncbi:MAG: hypothetical protein Q9170_006695, partial [Blastenia crenularia]